ncbi:MAG: hypothetical protein NC206_01925 [Bacteroides sp.]|nr:hypothetical protein [Roseburia sp.]MCM1345824.1 hypothetical protein [Bacteroides sp.]MCM1421289.1 hypothetical protein [Bacteroides sp.]
MRGFIIKYGLKAQWTQQEHRKFFKQKFRRYSVTVIITRMPDEQNSRTIPAFLKHSPFKSYTQKDSQIPQYRLKPVKEARLIIS